jgi:hypothetical protein
MKHNRHRLSRFMTARTFGMRAVGAWRRLLPDWTPLASHLAELERRPHEHGVAVRFVSYGWTYDDARWDVLLALLEWERRAERERMHAVNDMERLARETGVMDDNVISMDQDYERLRHDSEITVETPWCAQSHFVQGAVVGGKLTLVPNEERGQNWYTVRSLHSVRGVTDD